jgi:hypothetical protein
VTVDRQGARLPRLPVADSELELKLDDGGQSKAVSSGLSATVHFKESFNIARHDHRKQDVLHLCTSLSENNKKFIQGP